MIQREACFLTRRTPVPCIALLRFRRDRKSRGEGFFSFPLELDTDGASVYIALDLNARNVDQSRPVSTKINMRCFPQGNGHLADTEVLTRLQRLILSFEAPLLGSVDRTKSCRRYCMNDVYSPLSVSKSILR